MIYIEQWMSDEVEIATLPFPFQKFECSNEDWPAMASNNRFLLTDQDRNLCLFDRELILIKQLPWKHDRITEMCWSSTLNNFIITTHKDGVFVLNENLISIERIQTIEKKQW